MRAAPLFWLQPTLPGLRQHFPPDQERLPLSPRHWAVCFVPLNSLCSPPPHPTETLLSLRRENDLPKVTRGVCGGLRPTLTEAQALNRALLSSRLSLVSSDQATQELQ